MVKVQRTDLNGWIGDTGQIVDHVGEFEDTSYALSGIILKAIGNFAPQKEVVAIGTEVPEQTTNPIEAWILKNLLSKLKSQVITHETDPLKSGRSVGQIMTDIADIIQQSLYIAWSQDFEDCVEIVGTEATVTGIKIANVQLNTWIATLQVIRADVELCDDFNQADFIDTVKNGLINLPKLIATNVEQYIFNGFKLHSDGQKAKVTTTLKLIDDLIAKLNPSNFQDCQDQTPPTIDQKVVPPKIAEIGDPISILDPDPIPKPASEPSPDPSADCCTELVKAINKQGNLRDWFNLVIRWIRDTRIELKEARQDLKKVLAWIRDTRTELKEARTDLKKVLANQDLILSALSDLSLDVAVNYDEIINTQNLVHFNAKMLSIGMSGLANLISGLSGALAAILAALQSDIADLAKIFDLSQIIAAIDSLQKYISTGLLNLQAEILKIMLQIGKGFLRIEDLINPYVTGEIESYDWVEMTKDEKDALAKKQKDEDDTTDNADSELDNTEGEAATIAADAADAATHGAAAGTSQLIGENLIENFVDPASAIVVAAPVAITVTKAIALTVLKLNPTSIVYAGYGILGIVDVVTKLARIVNDVQGDIKEPTTLATSRIKIPTIAWFPEIYKLDKDGNRDYSDLPLAKDGKGNTIKHYHQAPDYSNSTPYIKLIEVRVPIGMEESYLCAANKEIDEFWQNQSSSPMIMMPEGWEQKPLKYRPQLEFFFVEVNDDGKYNRAVHFCLNVQHYDISLGKPKDSPLPDYTKGRQGGIMILDDGSKDIVYGKDKAEVFKVMQAIYAITDKAYSKSVVLTDLDTNNVKWFERDTAPNGNPINTAKVSAVWCDYFSTGRLNRTYAIQRDWRVRFDAVNLF